MANATGWCSIHLLLQTPVCCLLSSLWYLKHCVVSNNVLESSFCIPYWESLGSTCAPGWQTFRYIKVIYVIQCQLSYHKLSSISHKTINPYFYYFVFWNLPLKNGINIARTTLTISHKSCICNPGGEKSSVWVLTPQLSFTQRYSSSQTEIWFPDLNYKLTLTHSAAEQKRLKHQTFANETRFAFSRSILKIEH